MAKKEKLTTGKFDLDADLDFDAFNVDSITSQASPDVKKANRTPVQKVFKGVVGGAKSTLTSPAALASFTRRALPSQYGEVFDKADLITSNTTSLYNDAVRELKPGINRFVKEVDKLVPAESKHSKAFLEKIRKMLGEEVQASSMTAQQQIDQTVSSSVNEVFSAQVEEDARQRAEDTARSDIRDNVEGKRFNASFGVLTSIDQNLAKMQSYQSKVEQAYQKKSLELQFRSYFVQAEMLNTAKKYFAIFQTQNEAIAKNTALPEFVKLKQSERFKELARTKFMNSITSGLFGDGDFIRRGMENVRNSVIGKAREVKEGFDQAASGMEAYRLNKEMLQDIDPNDESLDKSTMVGSMIGSTMATKLGNKLGSKMREKFAKPGSKVGEFGYKLATGANNLEGILADKARKGYDSDAILKQKEGEGKLSFGTRKLAHGTLGKAASWLATQFNTGGPDATLAGGDLSSFATPNATPFNDHTQKSLTTIIPGYLARIYREIQILRTGDTNTELTDYNLQSGKFVGKSALLKSTKKQLEAIMNPNGQIESHLDNAVLAFTQGKKLSPEATEALKKKMLDLSFSETSYQAKNLGEKNIFKDLPPEVAAELSRTFSENFNAGDKEYHSKDYALTGAMKKIRGSIPDARGLIESLQNTGHGDILSTLGITDSGQPGQVSIKMEGLKRLIEESRSKPNGYGEALSDYEAKEGIRSFSPAKALEAMKKTKIAKWFYKQGRGDGGEHVGPMAQDIQRNFGETIAPGGKKIDLVSMNGANMAAIAQLAKEQESLKGNDKILAGIKDDTNKIVEILNKKTLGIGFGGQLDMKAFEDVMSRSLAKASELFSQGKVAATAGYIAGKEKVKGYIPLMSTMATSASSLAMKSISDLTSWLTNAGKNARSRVIDPTMEFMKNFYMKHKDKTKDTVTGLFSKGIELATGLMDRTKDLVMNKLPAGYRQAAEFASVLKKKAIDILDGPQDVYIKGHSDPILRAILMRGGEYFDQVTGNIILKMSDIKGTVVNKAGEVVISKDDIQTGLVDKDGQPIDALWIKIVKKGIGNIRAIGNRALDIGRNLGRRVLEGASAIKNTVLGKLPTGEGSGRSRYGLFGPSTNDILIEIRDLLDIRLPGKRMFKNKRKGAMGSGSQFNASEAYNAAKDKAGQYYEMAKEKAHPWLAKGKEKGLSLFDDGKKQMTALASLLMTKIASLKNKGDEKKAAFNDQDHNGVRDGSWRDRLSLLAKRKADREKNRKTAVASEAPRYMGGGILDAITSKAGAAFNAIKDGLSGLAGIIGFGSKGAAAKEVATTVANTAGAVKKAGFLSKALSVAKTGLMAGGLLTGGLGGAVLSAAGTALTAIGGVLASPVVLGAAALALTGYGAYKAYKYFTRDNASPLILMRLRQYGLSDSDESDYHKVFALESYLENEVVAYRDGQAYLMEKKLDAKKLLDIADISTSEENQEKLEIFVKWFNGRFKPIFLTHLTALFAVDRKSKLMQADKLKPEDKLKYLNAAVFESGPYDSYQSPFDTTKTLKAGHSEIMAAYQSAKTLIEKDVKTLKTENTKKVLGGAPIATASGAATNKEASKPEFVKVTAAMSSTVKPTQLPGEGDGVNEDKVDKSATGVAPEKNPGKIPLAGGKFLDGNGADQYLQLGTGVSLDGMNPSMLKQFRAMVQEYGEKTGKITKVNSGSRTTAQQEELYKRNPKLAAKPGGSLHEFGLAVDVDSATLNAMDELGLMRKYGFTRPIGGEPWHTEPAGIQVDIAKAKKDGLFASQAVQASLGRGGGGNATMSDAIKGHRDSQLAVSLLGDGIGTMPREAKEKVFDVTKVPLPKIAQTESSKAAPTAQTNVQAAATAPSGSTQPAKPSDIPKMAKTVTASIAASKSSIDRPLSGKSKLGEISEGEVGMTAKTDALGQPKSNNPEDIKNYIGKVAQSTGMDPDLLKTFAAVESSLNPNAKASSSSAAGLYQFTNATWDYMVDKNGNKYGVTPQDSPTDVRASTLMAAAYVKDNLQSLRSVKADAGINEAYLAHFLGPGGAKKFLQSSPDAIAAEILPSAAKANRNIFYAKDGRAYTVSEVYSLINNKLQYVGKQFGIDVPTSTFGEGSGRANVNAATESLSTQATPEYSAPHVDLAKGGFKSATLGNDSAVPGAAPTKTTVASTGSLFGNRPSTVLDSRPTTSASVQPITQKSILNNGAAEYLSKQLDVQTQMRDILQELLKTMHPESLMSALSKVAKGSNVSEANTKEPEKTNQSNRRSKGAVPDPVINMSRTI